MIDESTQYNLIEQAKSNLVKAFAPYSKYKVGTALLAASGKVYDGINVETCIYRATHGERMAMDRAVYDGEREFLAIAVVTDDPKAPFPCGQCLQDLTEFDNSAQGELEIIAANLKGYVRKTSLAQLLPERFGPTNLGIDVRDY